MRRFRRFPNPFSTSCGQRPPHFAGRTAEKQRFAASLDSTINKKPRNLAFVGDYGMGKTSLLFELSKETQLSKCTSVFLPCRRFQNELSFYNFLLQSISQSLPQSKLKKFFNSLKGAGFTVMGFGVSLQLKEPPADPIWGIVNALEQAYTILEQPLVFLIDDFHDLVETTRDSLQTLKQAFTVLSAQKEYPIMLAVAGNVDVFKGLVGPYDPIARFFEPMKLFPLSPEEVKDAVHIPIRDYEYKFDDESLDIIYEVSEGRPYYIQLCAYYALEESSGATICKLDIEKGLRGVLRQLAVEKYDRQIENASKTEKIILKIIASNEPMSHSQIVKTAKRLGVKESTAKMAIKRLLEEERYIRKSDLGYSLSEKMFREFLKSG